MNGWMFLPAQAWGVFAEVSPFESIQRHLNRPVMSQITPVLLLMIVGVAAIWAVLYLVDRVQRVLPQRPVDDRPAVFRRLAAEHGLSAEETRLLMSWGAALPDPVLLFVDPRLLEEHAARQPETAEAAVRLGRKLFDSAFLEPESATSRG